MLYEGGVTTSWTPHLKFLPNISFIIIIIYLFLNWKGKSSPITDWWVALFLQNICFQFISDSTDC